MIKVDYVFLCATYNRMSNIPFSIEVLCEAIVNRNEDAILLVIDNNSSDGTIEILKTLQKKYKMLEVVSSSDDLYWAQSMRLGFDYCKNNYNYSFLVPFNDDIDLKNSDLNMLFTKPATAEVHSFKDISGKHSYGGYKSRFIFTDLYQVAVKPNRTHQIIDTCNMNMVVIPFSYIKKVGFLQSYFIHRGGDTAWGYSVTRSGLELSLCNDYLGFCNRNPDVGTPKDIRLSKLERLRIFNSKKYYPFKVWFKYCKEYGGVLWPLLFLLAYVRILVK